MVRFKSGKTGTMSAPTKIFDVLRDEDVLIIVPQGAAQRFAYREVHMEANTLLRLVTESRVKNVVIDLHKLDYIDSVMIESILRVLTLARRRGCIAGFCNVSDTLREILSTVRLGEIWQHFPTRD